MEEKANKKPWNIRRIIIAAAGFTLLLATVLIFVLVFKPALTAGGDAAETSTLKPTLTAGSGAAEISAPEPVQPAGGDAAEVNAIEPLLYTSDGNVYMASGEHTVLLEGAKIVKDQYGVDTVDGEFCAYKGWLFYIANYEKTEGAGDLMRAAADGLSKPELVAQGVCDASVSGDGQRVMYAGGESAGSLYALDMAWDEPRLLAEGVSWYSLSSNGRRALYVCGDQNTGDLYSWEFAGEPEFISGGVCSEFCNGASLGHSFGENCGLSPNAENIYYVVRTANSGRDEYTLYIKIGSRKAEKVTGRGENSFLSGCLYGGDPLSDNGQMLYFGGGLVPLPPLYIFSPGGDTEHSAGECIVWTVFEDGSVLFESEGSLYCKAPGQTVQRMSEHPYIFPLFGYPFNQLPPGTEKRFLMLEAYTDLSEGPPEQATVFEQQMGKEKIKLCDVDGSPLLPTFDQSLTRLAYKLDGVLYVIQKENGEWSEPEAVSDTGYTEVHIYENIFDTAGECMYYRQRESEDAKNGKLYRYTIKTRRSELLMQDVREFKLVEDIPYAVTSDGTLFRADTGEQLVKGVINVTQAEDGAYIFTENDILYYGKDTDKLITLCEGTDVISAGGIRYLPPLSYEVAAALEELCDDAQRCIDALEAGKTESFWEYKAKAGALMARRDVSSELDGILIKFSEAFGNAGLWAASGQLGPEYKVLGDDTTIKDFSDAIKTCREYLEAEGKI